MRSTNKTPGRGMTPGPPNSPETSVVVVDNDVDICRTLQMLLEDEGYAVILPHCLNEAQALIDTAAEPMVLIVGNAEVIDYPCLQFFSAMATNPATKHAYLYLTTMPERSRLPELVQILSTLEARTVEMPFDLECLLAAVADAAARLRS